jgi:site-specific recombinase XerD
MQMQPMAQGQIPIKGLLNEYEASLTELGYGFSTRLNFLKRAELIVRRHENQGLEYFDPNIITEYAREIDERYFSGQIKKLYYWGLSREIQRFSDYIATGRINKLPNPLKGSRQPLSSEFERISEDFIAGETHPNTRCDIRWVTCKYFAWLEEQGAEDLSGVGATQIQKFLLFCSEKYVPSSIHNIKLYLKKLYIFLHETGLSDSAYSSLLSFAVNREKKVFPTLPKSDIAKLLDSIDRNTVWGKRAYAMMMLGTVLGLRACDVAALKLTNIDWVNSEIRILQSKTGRSVILPLTQDVGEALQDYILNARGESEAKQVFLRLVAPRIPLSSATTVGEAFRDCCKAAGLPATTRFHTLRRSLGTSMINAGVEVTTAAQVFGDAKYDSMKQYIAVDTEHLKLCALSFDGIEPKGGDAQ